MKKTVTSFIALVFILTCVLSTASFAEMPSNVPLISEAPKNLQWPEGSLASYQCVCDNDKGHDKFTYEWHIVFDGADYKVDGGLSAPWTAFVDTKSGNTGLVGNALFLDGVKMGLDGAQIYCTVKSSYASVSTPAAVISVIGSERFTPPAIKSPVFVGCEQGDKVELSVKGTTTAGNVDQFRDYISYHWYKTPTGKIQDITLIETGKDMYENNVLTVDTSAPGTFYYVCGVFDGEENAAMCNYSYTNVIEVDVAEKIENIGMEILTMPSKTKYNVGDHLDLSGLVVRIIRSDGYMNLKDGKGITAEPKTLTKAGDQTVKLRYEELSAEFTVKVVSPEVPKPTITKQPEGGVFTAGDGAVLTVEAKADGDHELGYQWYKADGVEFSDAAEINGETKNTFKPPETEGDSYYLCYVYTVNGADTSAGLLSEVAKVTYNKPTGTVTETVTESAAETESETAAGTDAQQTADVSVDTTISGETPGTADTAAIDAETKPAENQGGGAVVVILIIVAAVLLLALAGVIVLIIILSKKKAAAKE